MPNLSQEFPQFRTLRRPDAVCAVLLKKRRRWFDGEGENEEGDPPDDEETNGDNAGEDNSGGDLAKRITSLEKRLEERDGEIAQLRKERDDARKANKRRQEEEGNWKTLYEESQVELESLKPYKAEAEAALGSIQESNERKIKQIPESKRHIVPELPPMKLQEWLDRSLADLTREPAPDFDAGAGGNHGGTGKHDDKVTVTDRDRAAAEQAQALGHKISAEDIAKRRVAKEQQTSET